MRCDSAAEFVSALSDGEVISREAAEHIGGCAECQERLRDFLTIGVELRRVASLEMTTDVPARGQTKRQSPVERWWQKGWEGMRIPKFAFASMFLVIMALAASLLVVKVGARSNGTVVLLSTAGPSGPLADFPLSTQEKNQASWFGIVGSYHLAYRVGIVSRDGNRVLLVIHTRTFQHGDDLSAFTQNTDPVAAVNERWLEPGEPLKLNVREIGTLTLTGVWMDHVPLAFGSEGQDFSAGAGEVRMIDALFLKDKIVVGDMGGLSDSVTPSSNPDEAMGIYVPGQGRFLISQLPMKGAVEAYVDLGRIRFEEGGHSWEFVAGAPVSREQHLWVLHQPDFKLVVFGKVSGTTQFANQKLIESEPGVWVPEQISN